MTTPLLHIDELAVEYRSRGRVVRSLDGVELTLGASEVVGVAGESGSGKSTLAAAIGRLMPSSALRVGGDVYLAGRSIFELDAPELREARRSTLGFVFQSPISTFDPTMRIRPQLRVALGARGHDLGRLLAEVGLQDPDHVLAAYPHQLSGGMAQRVAIAAAMAREPKLLVADEPTASLDPAVRSLVLELLAERARTSGTALMIFTHDLRAVARFCDRVVVLYAGRTVEAGRCDIVFDDPAHPYTIGLLDSAVGAEDPGEALRPIPGVPPILHDASPGCGFASRCRWATTECRASRPEMRDFRGRDLACHNVEQVVRDAV